MPIIHKSTLAETTEKNYIESVSYAMCFAVWEHKPHYKTLKKLWGNVSFSNVES